MSNTRYDTPLSIATAEWSGHFSTLPLTVPAVVKQAIDHGTEYSEKVDGSREKIDSTTTSAAAASNGVARSGPEIKKQTCEIVTLVGGSTGDQDDQSPQNGTPSSDLNQCYSIVSYGDKHDYARASRVCATWPPKRYAATAVTEANGHHQLPNLLHRSEDAPGRDYGTEDVHLTGSPLPSDFHPSQFDSHSAGSFSQEYPCPQNENAELIGSPEPGKATILPLVPAAAKKMKRFRLTHKQTRFLVSEFTKQPHPDAALRERFSREIPGLSARQVQVWFQNRRAKVKRMAADDHERMIKMRAVPVNFDNIQALHSPYGVAHNLCAPMTTACFDYSAAAAALASTYPGVVDVHQSIGSSTMASGHSSQQHSRQLPDQHIQPTPCNFRLAPSGLGTGYDILGYGPVAAVGSLAHLSPLPSTSSSSEHEYSSCGTTSTGSTPVLNPPALDFRFREKGKSVVEESNSRARLRGNSTNLGQILPSPMDCSHESVLSSVGLGSFASYPGMLRYLCLGDGQRQST
ncbi:hypothetical protein SEPCBS119000_006053 [Sporothrix epigloea]|uniref:Homeobox domain-containing protein n=1 Tax=Sporothrix epigloea TaxID=1892477 RepID=A0ABP0E180_9PEZI